MAQAQRKDLIARLEQARGSRVLCYLTSDRPNADAKVAKDTMPIFYEHLRALAPEKKVDVLVFTQGGDTLAAFGLSRLIREFAPWVGTLVPSKCMSAGTLFALGADEIVMTRAGTLSPIDPSITGPLNPVVELSQGQRQIVPLSVESVAGFRALVSDDWEFKEEASRLAAFKLLGERVNPLALGDVFRARQQIELLASTLLKQHTKEKDLKKVVKTLTKELGSHDYIISRQEAKELLGNQVTPADAVTEDLIWSLFSDFANEMELGVIFEPAMVLHASQARPVRFVQKLAIVESLAGSDVFEREMIIAEVQLPIPGLPPGSGTTKGIQQEAVRLGWKKYPPAGAAPAQPGNQT